MTKTLTPMSKYTQQVERYQVVSVRLVEALQGYNTAKAASDNARDAYEDARRDLITRGFHNAQARASAEEKETALSNALRAELLAVRIARDALRVADAELESARVLERAERETLRSIQHEYEFHGYSRSAV